MTMTPALAPELAAAYVHELSADVRAVVVLGKDGAHLAGPEALAAPARALEPGVVRVPEGVVWVARGPQVTVVAAGRPTAVTGPTALDVAAAAGATKAVEARENPSPELKMAVQALLRAV